MKKHYQLILKIAVCTLFLSSCKEKVTMSEKQKAFITVADQLKKYFGPGSDTTYMSIDSNYNGNYTLANKYYIDTMNYDFITIHSLALKFFPFDYFFFLPVYDYNKESKNTTIKDSIITCTKGLLVQDLKTNNYFISLKSENNLGRRYTPLLPVLDRGYVPFDSSELRTYFRLNDQFYYLNRRLSMDLTVILNNLPLESKENINSKNLDSLFVTLISNLRFRDEKEKTEVFSSPFNGSAIYQEKDRTKVRKSMDTFLKEIKNTTEETFSQSFGLNKEQKTKNLVNFKSFMDFINTNFGKENFFVYFTWENYPFFSYIVITVNEEDLYSEKMKFINDTSISKIKLLNNIINHSNPIMYKIKIYQFYADAMHDGKRKAD